MDSGPEETPGTSEEERLMPGPSEVPSGAFIIVIVRERRSHRAQT